MSNSFNDISVRHDLQTVAFYNLENLFDTSDDKHTFDNDFLPMSVKKWTPKRYQNKLRKLGFAISNIGRHETGKHAAIVGLAEVENASVIEDLIASEHLKDCNYDYVHYDSLDERGIDVALLYDTNAFEVLSSDTFTIELFDDDGSPDYTRDILLVSGLLDGEAIHVIVNHWSSRREGAKETEHKRIASSDKAGEIISMLRNDDPDAKIIVVGDFNDDPSSNSIKRLVEGFNLYNPMETLRSYNRGTTNHKRQWNLFDQILFSTNFFKSTTDQFEFSTANIFDEDYLKLFDGKYKGAPFRTYVGKKYKGGYSDHFPVYAIFKK
ncbi:endonuclease/exonuclease/phosphatase family protein [Flavivirga eckloniae]|uniref:Endonuclease n=1 Tax=Flavivirga eckloniae TaxID=1803846 RepID=A0A2K9PRX3_9FLAO|nr:endonuclease/exonuclease/phosphatase family protein [Flavivirga eckloniae]AUP79789.1 endonuclease [Flavivirga eckloniae]